MLFPPADFNTSKFYMSEPQPRTPAHQGEKEQKQLEVSHGTVLVWPRPKDSSSSAGTIDEGNEALVEEAYLIFQSVLKLMNM